MFALSTVTCLQLLSTLLLLLKQRMAIKSSQKLPSHPVGLEAMEVVVVAAFRVPTRVSGHLIPGHFQSAYTNIVHLDTELFPEA